MPSRDTLHRLHHNDDASSRPLTVIRTCPHTPQESAPAPAMPRPAALVPSREEIQGCRGTQPSPDNSTTHDLRMAYLQIQFDSSIPFSHVFDLLRGIQSTLGDCIELVLK